MPKLNRGEHFRSVINIKLACFFAISLYLPYSQIVFNNFLIVNWISLDRFSFP